MSITRRSALVACLMLMAACASAPVRPAGAPPASDAATVTLVHFNDVYEIGPVEGGKYGGLARVATLVDELKRASPPVLVTLGGDYVSPSAIGTARVNGESLAGRQMVDVLNAVGLEWATLGNHEFDIPAAAFAARMAESKFRVIISNATAADGTRFPNTMPWAVVPVTAAGRTLRLGLLGLVIDSNAKNWVTYAPPVDAARAATREMGAVDAVIALTHLTLAGDADLAVKVPEIDLILGGHEHENWEIRRGEHFTPIIKADANVRSLAIVSMRFGAAGTRPTVTSRLQIVDDRVPEMPAVAALVSRWTTTAFDAFRRDGFAPDTAVVTLPEPLDGRESVVRNRDDKLTQIIANAVRRDADAEVGIFNGGSIRIDDVLPAGPVTEYDVIRVLPFGGNVLRVEMTGALLARVLETGLGNQGSGGFLHASDGTTHDANGWSIGGARLDPARIYVVGISDFLMTGAEVNLGFLTRTAPGVGAIDARRDIRRAVIDELKRLYPR